MRKTATFQGANVFMSRNLVPPEMFDALHDALKLNGANVFLCCDPSRTAPNDYHVIESSDHEKFEDLRAKGCNLIGPQCVFACASEVRALPNQGFTCCLAMDGSKVLASGFQGDEKVMIEKLVIAMGGVLQTQTSSDVNFVIVKNVLAGKYKWALNTLKKPIVTVNWLYQCWKEHRTVSQDLFRVLPFSGLTISVTRIPAGSQVVSVKVIRNKQTCQSEGYGFIEFNSRAGAERVLQTFNGTPMPNGAQNFRLNWASAGEKRSDDTPDYTIFVGDLAADVTDYVLQETFRAHYPSCKSAKVVIDRLTGRTKGYGFVKFGDESEQMRAMTEMNGVLCSTRPMRIGPAANKNAGGSQQFSKVSYQNSQGAKNESDPNNTTIFVGNLDGNVTDDHLRQVFSKYGELLHVKIPMGKRCGFVQFADRSCAEEALRVLNGSQLGAQNIRLSWGRSPSNKQPQADPSQWNGGGGYYGYATPPDGYGYAQVSQDPNVYYGSYPAAGYGNYQQPQQQQQQVGYS